MIRARVISAVAATALYQILAPVASAQLDDRLWIGGTGNQLWQLDANWNPAPFPNDPGRVDPDPAVITNVIGANLGVNLPANLTVDVGATDVTVASLTMGSTSNPVTTNVTSTGAGRLVFENFESNNETPDPDVCAFNCGVAQITSGGVAGATNIISAVVGVNDHIDVTGHNALTITGNLIEMPGASTTGDVSLRARTAGSTVFINGGITTIDIPVGTEEIPLGLNSSIDSVGTIDVNSVISGPGRMRYGSASQSNTIPGKVILRAANNYSGRTILGRGTTVLANNSAFGTADVKEEGPSEGSLQTGYNIESDNDARVIANTRIVGQWLTIKGQHSLTWSGIVYQDNRRGWINMLPADKTLTLSGPQYPNHTEENPPLPGRDITYDGTGRTLVTGPLHDELQTMGMVTNPGNFRGSFSFRGTGTVVVSSAASTYTGDTFMEGANVHFATNASLGNTARIVSDAGAVGVDAGVIGNSTFLSKLNSASNPAADAGGNLVVYDRGGLMLGASEYGSNLDFNSGDLANAANMTLAAHETGSSYTGMIAPANSTYRLGGGSGVLTLPIANQLTGANSVVATNGGEVRPTASNNYTGTTSVLGKYVTTLQNAAAANTPNFADGDNVPNDQFFLGTTLTVSSLANGGVPSNIGSSSNAASNLHINGSTFKYTGGAASTDRLFTIGTNGATVDASGTGAVSFTNTAALGVDIAETRTGTINTFSTGTGNTFTVRALTSTEDLRPGMTISATGIPAGATITKVTSATEVTFAPASTSAFSLGVPVSFGPAPERRLTLSGSNTANNTLASIIPNASDSGVVGVTKSGSGKWILTGNNSYTGLTRIENGTLSITNPYLADASDVRIFSGGIFDLNFSGNDLIDELFFDGAPQAAGTWGAIGNGLAANQSAFFTGTGVLQVGMFNISTLLGDYNQNGVVDAADYIVWREAAAAGATTLTNRSGNITGAVGQADYNFWRSRFGMAVATGAALSGGVPEPAAGLLATSACWGCWLGQIDVGEWPKPIENYAACCSQFLSFMQPGCIRAAGPTRFRDSMTKAWAFACVFPTNFCKKYG